MKSWEKVIQTFPKWKIIKISRCLLLPLRVKVTKTEYVYEGTSRLNSMWRPMSCCPEVDVLAFDDGDEDEVFFNGTCM